MYVRNKYIIFAFILLNIATFDIKSEYLVHTYTQDEGLPASTTYSVTQDRSGVIWVSTLYGIVKYNGVKWINFNIKDSNFTNSRFKEVFSDENYNIWSIDISNGARFVNLNNPKQSLPNINEKNIPINRVLHYYISNQKSVRAAFSSNNKGVWIFDNNSWKYYDIAQKYNINIIYAINANPDAFLIATDKGIYEIRKEIMSDYINDKFNLGKDRIFALVYDKEIPNKLWVLSEKYIGYFWQNQLYKINQKIDIKIPSYEMKYSLLPNYFNSIVYGNGDIVELLNLKKNDAYSLSLKSGLINKGCNNIFLDREGILWIASDRGISKISSMRFSNYNSRLGLLDDEVSALIKINDKSYLAGHNNGFTMFSNSGVNKQFPIKYSTNNNRINRIVKKKDGEIIASAQSKGLVIITPKLKFKYISPNILGVTTVNSVAIDSNQNILFSDIHSLYIFDGKSSTKIYEIPTATIRDIFITKSNEIVLTTTNQGILFQKKGKFYNYISNNKGGLSTYAVYQDAQNVFWIATANGLYTIKDNALTKLDYFSEALNGKKIFSILSTKSKDLWLGTDNGVVHIKDNKIRTYGVKDGLAGSETNRGALIEAEGNNVVIGTIRGLSIYNNQFDIIDTVKPLIQIKNLKINNKYYSTLENIKVHNDENNLKFELNISSFYDENHNTVYYKLVPYNSDFIELTNTDSYILQFDKLNPGKYQLIVKVKNALGVWSDEIISPTIEITPPYYLTVWFIILLLLLIGIIAYVVIRYFAFKKYQGVLEKEIDMRSVELESSEGRYRKMFYDNNAMMLIMDPETINIEDANPAAIEYFEQIGYVYKPGDSLFTAGKIPGFTPEEIFRILNNEKEYEFEFEFILPDKNISFNRFYKAFLTQININDKYYIHTILNDITDKKNAERQLQQLNQDLEAGIKERTVELEEALEIVHSEIVQRMQTEADLLKAKDELTSSLEREKELSKLKTQFIMMVSHEYRTPLTIIYSSAEIIREFIKIGQVEACLEYAGRIQQSVSQLTKLMEDSMKIGDDSNIKVHIEKFDYIEFISSTVEEFKIKIKNSHKIITESLSSNIIIEQDRNILKQAIMNILENAAKFSENNSDIVIRNILEEKQLKIEIQDSGIGMDTYTLERIFDPFFKATDTIGLISGTGLGLPIAKKYILVLEGSISAKSEKGKGTTMTIKLPLNINHL